MRDKLILTTPVIGFDEELNPIQEERSGNIVKCCIFPNDKAQQVSTNDGEAFIYHYAVLYRLKDETIKEGDTIRLMKKDGSVDSEFIVKGRCTIKRYCKIWV